MADILKILLYLPGRDSLYGHLLVYLPHLPEYTANTQSICTIARR
jgi:hypothetical protein